MVLAQPLQSHTRKTTEREVVIGPLRLAGNLRLPAAASALVVFAHGSGSSRLSPRNRMVAKALNEQGIATLLFDLLTPDEEQDRANVFDIALLAARLVDVVRWMMINRHSLVFRSVCSAPAPVRRRRSLPRHSSAGAWAP